MNHENWNGFKASKWCDEINVRDFIQSNYCEYKGDESFLAGPTEATVKLWDKVLELYKQEKDSEGGVLEIDTKLENEALEKAKEAETIIFYGGQTDYVESEGFDRDNMLSMFEAEELRSKTLKVLKKLNYDMIPM